MADINMRSVSRWIVAASTWAAVALSCAGLPTAGHPQILRIRSVEATIEALDAKKDCIVLVYADGMTPVRREIKPGAGAIELLVEGKKAKIGDLRAKDKVAFRENVSTKTIIDLKLIDRPKDKPKLNVLVNSSGDIQVVSERTESIAAFFQRHRIIVGGLQRDKCETLKSAVKPVEKVFLNYASYNDDKMKTALFGANVTIAPLQDEVKKLLSDHLAKNKDAFSVTMIVRRDAKAENLYHVVGMTGRRSVGFFDQSKRVGKDDFSQADLWFKGEK